MDFRISTFLAALCLTLSLRVNAGPQRALNSLPSAGKSTPLGLKEGAGNSNSNLNAESNSKSAKIMKQINNVNDDGSYTFGYEADDGSFRVETRSKDGVVKGKYGYVDANGELKVMEYTAGEKTPGPQEPDEDDQPRDLSRFSIPNQIQAQARSDQNVAAQTATATSAKLTGGRENSNESDDGASGESDGGKSEDVEGDADVDVNNGQYFRAVPQAGPSASSGQGQGPPGAGGQGPRYIPSDQIGQQPHPQYAPQLPQGFSTRPQSYPGAVAGTLPPRLAYEGQGQGQGGFNGFGGQREYSPQVQGPYIRQGPGQRGQVPSPYAGVYDEPEAYNGVGPGPQSAQDSPQGEGPRGPLGGFNPNVQLQFRGSPRDQSSPQRQQQAYFPQGPQDQGRQFGQSQSQGEDPYAPNVELDGFSEDADEDGFVDEAPNGLGRGGGGGTAAAQEKQGVAVRPGGSAGAYSPQVLGPQGILQGGQVNPQPQREQFGGGAGRNPFLGQGGQGPQGQRPQGGQGQGQLPQLTDEQIQQLFAQQQQYEGAQGPQGQYFGQGQGGQFGGGGQFPPSGFTPQQQQRPQYLGRPQGGFGGQGGQGPFLGQGQYLGGQGSGQQGQGQGGIETDDQDQFAGFPPQFLPQGQGGQFPGQGFPGQGPSQGGFLQGGQGQYLQGGPNAGGFLGQGQGQGFPPQTTASQGPQGGSQGGQGSQGGIQSSGFPFDFNPYGGLPGGPPQQGFQGAPPQGFPGQFSQSPYPGQGGQGGSFPSLSPQQIAALQSQGAQGGFPGSQGGFGAPIQGYVPGRNPGQGFPGAQFSQGPQGPYFQGQGQGGPSGGSAQEIRQPGPISIQLGGGAPRPVQPSTGPSAPPNQGQGPSSGLSSTLNLAGGLFGGGEERKQVSSSSNANPGKGKN